MIPLIFKVGYDGGGGGEEADGYLICMNIGGCRLSDGVTHHYLKLSPMDQQSKSK